VTLTSPPIFDGHNDVLLQILRDGGPARARDFLTGRDGAIDLPKSQAGGFGGGFFAVFIPSPADKELKFEEMNKDSYDLPLPPAIDWHDAMPIALEKISILRELERLEALKICTTAADLRHCLETGKLAAILHIEGAEAIDADLHALDVLHAAGLRSIGPVWSRPTIFGHGVPFRYPHGPDIGDGLTDVGKALIRRCNDLSIMVDLSHLNEKGFWDVAKISDAPLVATHSNCFAICPHPRNLTDDQLRAIADSDGMVGLNFAVAFLRKDGKMRADVPLSQMMKHLDHLMNILGEDRVGMGSDYDGAVTPEEVTTVAQLPALRQAMIDHGYGTELIEKLCYKNWLRVLEKTWGA
jgi:membrane dipeptidase